MPTVPRQNGARPLLQLAAMLLLSQLSLAAPTPALRHDAASWSQQAKSYIREHLRPLTRPRIIRLDYIAHSEAGAEEVTTTKTSEFTFDPLSLLGDSNGEVPKVSIFSVQGDQSPMQGDEDDDEGEGEGEGDIFTLTVEEKFRSVYSDARQTIRSHCSTTSLAFVPVILALGILLRRYLARSRNATLASDVHLNEKDGLKQAMVVPKNADVAVLV